MDADGTALTDGQIDMGVDAAVLAGLLPVDYELGTTPWEAPQCRCQNK